MMDLQSTLVAILVLLVASRVAAELSERIKQPSVLAEIGLGIALGPSALGLVSSTEIVQLLAEIGVILLLFEVGRQMSVKELRHTGPDALRVAFLGLAAPMLLAYPTLLAFGVDGAAALFLAAGITATSVGITARVFADLRSLATPEGRIVMGAGVADDIIGLLLLTVVASVAAGERVTAASVGVTVALSIGFLVAAVLAGVVLIPRLLDGLSRRARTDGTLMAAGVALAFGLAFASSAAGLAPIIGAFVAGLAVGRSDSAPELHRRLTPLGHFFIPIFFINIGLSSDVGVFARADVLGIAAALTACAIVGKLVSGLGAKRGSADRFLIGVAMIPRGEVGLVFATLGLSRGVLDARLYGVLLAVVLATTIITPPWMRLRMQGRRHGGNQRKVPADALVLDALTQPDITESAATHIAQRRTEGVAAILNVPPEQLRQDIMQMPRRYLLAHDEATIARHLRMVEAPLTRFQSRLETEFEGQDRWIVHVALLDRRGALAIVAGALASCGASVVGAHIATWRNGLALDVFRVEASSGTDWDAARRRIDASLTAGPSGTPVQSIEGEVTIDNDASPWHSIVEVHATDRAGLLTRVASTLSAAGLQIHQAVIATVDGKAVDTFWVTGDGGGKLNTSGERALRDAFAGRAPRRFRLPRRRLRALDYLPS